MNILPDLTAIRGRVYCGRCGGAFYSLGPESRWVPHQPGCPRGPKNVAGADANSRSTGAVRHDGELPQHRPLNVEAPLAGTEAGEPESRREQSSLGRGSTPTGTPAASTEQQDQEREALTEVESPFPIDHSRRTVFPGRSYWEPDYDIGTGWNE